MAQSAAALNRHSHITAATRFSMSMPSDIIKQLGELQELAASQASIPGMTETQLAAFHSSLVQSIKHQIGTVTFLDMPSSTQINSAIAAAVTLSADQRCVLANAVSNRHLQLASSCAARDKKRCQSIEYPCAFFTSSDFAFFLDNQNREDQKINRACDRLRMLNIGNLKETPTVRNLVAMLAACMYPVSYPTQADFLRITHSIKNNVSQNRSRLDDSVCSLVTFPPTASDLPRDLFAHAYPDPADPPVYTDLERYHEYVKLARIREDKSAAHSDQMNIVQAILGYNQSCAGQHQPGQELGSQLRGLKVFPKAIGQPATPKAHSPPLKHMMQPHSGDAGQPPFARMCSRMSRPDELQYDTPPHDSPETGQMQIMQQHNLSLCGAAAPLADNTNEHHRPELCNAEHHEHHQYGHAPNDSLALVPCAMRPQTLSLSPGVLQSAVHNRAFRTNSTQQAATVTLQPKSVQELELIALGKGKSRHAPAAAAAGATVTTKVPVRMNHKGAAKYIAKVVPIMSAPAAHSSTSTAAAKGKGRKRKHTPETPTPSRTTPSAPAGRPPMPTELVQGKPAIKYLTGRILISTTSQAWRVWTRPITKEDRSDKQVKWNNFSSIEASWAHACELIETANAA
jgi:hypothetical protein